MKTRHEKKLDLCHYRSNDRGSISLWAGIAELNDEISPLWRDLNETQRDCGPATHLRNDQQMGVSLYTGSRLSRDVIHSRFGG